MWHKCMFVILHTKGMNHCIHAYIQTQTKQKNWLNSYFPIALVFFKIFDHSLINVAFQHTPSE